DQLYQLHGELTVRDITRPITLDVEYGGVIKDPYGLTRAGFAVAGSINRRDYNLRWSALTEAGGMVVSDDVRINCEVQITKQQPQS
ncbi:MAG TPA: YceI family protein, partial [Chitinophagales bacterium]|nr:YceI family protein [Chitinophagales bacterium]